MKRLLPLLTSILAFTLLVAPAFAQQSGGQRPGGPGSERRGPGMMRQGMGQVEARVLAKMNLTAKQKADIKALNDRIQKQMEAIRKDEKMTREQKMQRMRAIGQEKQQGMSKILTKTQQEQYRKLMAEEMKKLREQREKQGGRQPGRTGGSKNPAKP